MGVLSPLGGLVPRPSMYADLVMPDLLLQIHCRRGCFKSQILHSTWSAAASAVTNGGILAADILKALIGVVTRGTISHNYFNVINGFGN